ncbi:MAG: four helix bundle protein [bacterium]|nr:four helix bundle protein [bacterium]
MDDEKEINEIFRFRKFPVYHDAREFRKNLKKYTQEHFPQDERYCLRAQLWRALDSIVLNIAEGSDRYTGKSNSHFLNIAVGSLDEVVAGIDAACDDGYMDREKQLIFLGAAVLIMKQLKALSSTIRRNSRSN